MRPCMRACMCGLVWCGVVQCGVVCRHTCVCVYGVYSCVFLVTAGYRYF